MDFKSIPNQPIHFNTIDTSYCDFKDEICQVYSKDDEFIYSQIQLEPCGSPDCNGTINGKDASSITKCWEWDKECWILVDDGNENWHFKHVGGDCNHTLVNNVTLIGYGNYFGFTFTLFNVISGSITVQVDGNTIGIYNSNGTFTAYGYSLSNGISFIASNDFVGELDNLSIQSYNIPTDKSLWLGIVDINCPTCPPLSDCVEYFVNQNYITIRISLLCLETGCYRLRICSPCQFIYPAPFYYSKFVPSKWTIQYYDNSIYTWNGSEQYLDFVWRNSEDYDYARICAEIPNDLENDCCRTIKIGLEANYDFLFYLKINGNSEIFYSVTPDTTEITIEICERIDTVCIRIKPEAFDDQLIQPLIKFKYMSIAYNFDCIDYDKQCYDSNCFQIIDYGETNDTVLVKAFCDANSYELGLNWDNIFFLQQRLNLFKYAPTYNIDAKDYIYSDGTRKLTSGQKQKFYDFIFKQLDEIQHDVLSTQILCTNFWIDGIEYFVDPKDYKPEWDKKTGYQLADVRIQAMKQGTIIFKANQN